MLVLAVAFALLSFVASKLLAPRKPSAAKSAPYECGIVPTQDPPERFPVRFYLIAMIFIVFDIEIIFLYPYAVVYRDLGGFGLAEVVVFAVSVFASFVFLIANGALDWGPAKRSQRSELQVSARRTLASTVRRVGTEGREEAGREVAA
ncbi:MAG TPA: NADH-quinone oxidoreductase subunit A [Acidimicrobiales bacterium]